MMRVGDPGVKTQREVAMIKTTFLLRCKIGKKHIGQRAEDTSKRPRTDTWKDGEKECHSAGAPNQRTSSTASRFLSVSCPLLDCLLKV